MTRRRTLRGLLAAGLAVSCAVTAYAGLTMTNSSASAAPGVERPLKGRPIVIGHRGASKYRPEHTLSSYRLAISQGADFIEPDVVSTKDRQLVARHDNWLADTTDVENHPEFADRKKTKMVDGGQVTDWFTEDFTLAELKTLKAEERIPDIRPENTVFNGIDTIPTLDEVLKLAREHDVGVYPETKHPTYFDDLGLSLEEPLLEALKKHGFHKRPSKVFIQSFETANLRELAKKTRIPLIQLIETAGKKPYDFVKNNDPRTYDDLVKPEGLKWIASYADGIGPHFTRIVPLGTDGKTGEPTSLVRDAHRARLAVHPFTFRPENNFLPTDFQQGTPQAPNFKRAQGNAPGWLAMLLKLGVDGVWCDDPASGVASRRAVYGR